MTKGYVQVPPQSTGKKVATEERTEIYYDNATGSFNVGDVITGQTSGATGTVTGVQTEGYISTEGELYLSKVTGTFQNNENLQVSAATVAVAKLDGSEFTQTDYAVQKIVITDPNNLENNQKIDRFGATLNTFTNGSPQFGPFNTMFVGEPWLAKSYSFQYDNLSAKFWDDVVGTGSTTHEAQKATSLLSTGTASGDRITRTSHYYNPYYPTVGNDILMSVQAGDMGKANVVRRWGVFDDNNGFFWELDGTTLSVVVRSNTSGSVVDTKVTQANFNRDRLDGTNGISFNLDVSAGNIYWIDYQWSGRIQFGVFEPDGEKLVAHSIENVNAASIPYTRTATLPARIEQYNSGVAASSSELRCSAIAQRHLSKIVLDGQRHSVDSGTKTITTASGETPVISLRPKTTFNSITNRTIFRGISIAAVNLGTEPILLKIRGCTDASLTGEAFASHAVNSSTEIDTTATAFNATGVATSITTFIAPGDTLFEQNIGLEDGHQWENFLYADGVTQPVFCITAESLSGTSTDIRIGVQWEESRV